MGFADPHDPRKFTHYAKLDTSGAVVAIVEVADENRVFSHPDLVSNAVYVDVTDLRTSVDVYKIAVTPKVVAASAQTDPAFRFDVITAFHAAVLRATMDAIFNENTDAAAG